MVPTPDLLKRYRIGLVWIDWLQGGRCSVCTSFLQEGGLFGPDQTLKGVRCFVSKTKRACHCLLAFCNKTEQSDLK